MAERLETEAEERARLLAQPLAAEMVATARRLVAERGVIATKMTDVERETRTPKSKHGHASPGQARYYFGTKEELLIALLHRELDERRVGMQVALRGVRTRRQLAAALLEQFHAFKGTGAPVLRELAVAARTMPRLAQAQRVAYRRWRLDVRDLLIGLDRRGVLACDEHAEEMAALLTGVGIGLAALERAEPDWQGTNALAFAIEVAASWSNEIEESNGG